MAHKTQVSLTLDELHAAKMALKGWLEEAGREEEETQAGVSAMNKIDEARAKLAVRR